MGCGFQIKTWEDDILKQVLQEWMGQCGKSRALLGEWSGSGLVLEGSVGGTSMGLSYRAAGAQFHRQGPVQALS